MRLPASKLIFLTLVLLLADTGCQQKAGPEPAETQLAKSLMLEWNRLFLELERFTPGYRVPVTARAFAYVMSAAYQSALPYLTGSCSLEKYFPDFQPSSDFRGKFYLPASLNAAYAEILRDFFPTAPPHLQEKINLLEAEQAQQLRMETDPTTYRLSANYGKRSAVAVWRWSATDSLGHDAFLNNYDQRYVLPVCQGCWQPDQEHPAQQPLLPHWGEVRSFLVPRTAVAVKAPVTYDVHPGSDFYAGAMEVYSVSNPIAKENSWIAEFWSDDVPGFTVSPTGRWISIANQAVEKSEITFPEMLELYLKLGYAMSDALVICWDAKYRFNLERPADYIRRYIRSDWKPLHDSPLFPAYPSGHSAVGAAASTVLIAKFGSEFTLTDRTHENRLEFAGKPRTYSSFSAMAQENAFSRIVLGVHYRMDCEEGLRIGRLVGQKITGLQLVKDEVSMLDHKPEAIVTGKQ